MNEIEKMYENAGVQSFKTCEFCTQKSIDCLKGNTSNITCGLSKDAYPPFTAEKELKLIKWFAHSGHFSHQTDYLPWLVDNIASNINFLWNKFSDAEQQQIKEILE